MITSLPPECIHARFIAQKILNPKLLLSLIVLSSLRFLSMLQHPENVIKSLKSDLQRMIKLRRGNKIAGAVVGLLRPRFTCTRPDKQLFVTPIKHQPRQLVTLLHFPSRSPYLVNCNKMNCEKCRTLRESHSINGFYCRLINH